MGSRLEPPAIAPHRRTETVSSRKAAPGESPPDSIELAPTPRAGRLVVVSNRVPLPTKDGSSSAGGLAVALEGALKQQGGLWFGWSGKTVDRRDNVPSILQSGNITFAVLDVLKKDFDLYYTGFANRALWPICHYRIDLLQIDRDETEGYFRVNRTFAEALEPLLRPDDVVWIHDYHFIPLAEELRRLGCRNRIGFFLHIPWPPADVASALPAYMRLLNALTAYDVVGFHTPQDADNFRHCLVRERIGFSLSNGEYQVEGHRFRIGVFPVGIDTEAFARTAAGAERNPLVRRMRESMGNRALIIGVDRLDYSKGIKERIEAFSCFLRANPQWRNQVTYLQVTPKSRSDVPEYKKMQHEIAEQAGWTNGNLGEVDWTPIRYINKTVGHTALAGLYRMARVGLVTPLRDGMNLVAKEFVASQNPRDPGVLILSRFAGAMYELCDGALLVNPYDTEATAGAVARALDMPLDERRERWMSLMDSLRTNSIGQWCENFLDALREQPQTAVLGGPAGGFGSPSSRMAHAAP
jgi:trehalose 6-phosphate synthase